MDNQHVLHDMIRQEPVLAILRRQQGFRFCNRKERPQQFREKAEELRTIAEDVILQDTRQMLLRLAETYDLMAQSMEWAETLC